MGRRDVVGMVNGLLGGMMTRNDYFVYIMTNQSHSVLYTGVTNDLQRRVFEHKSGRGGTFTSRYHIKKLVYFEVGCDIQTAISREKQIKAGSRQKKVDLVNSMNPHWKDLFEEGIGA